MKSIKIIVDTDKGAFVEDVRYADMKDDLLLDLALAGDKDALDEIVRRDKAK